MEKEVTIKFGPNHSLFFNKEGVQFFAGMTGQKTWLPIEVFYQMWNSDELINFMEQYHKDREDVSTRVA